MKKLIFALFVAAFTMTSCSTSFKTAKQGNVKPTLAAAVVSDLEVSNQKITYTYIPTAAVRRCGYDNCKATAISEALKQYGDADVLVETREATVVRKDGFFNKYGKIKSDHRYGLSRQVQEFPLGRRGNRQGRYCQRRLQIGLTPLSLKSGRACAVWRRPVLLLKRLLTTLFYSPRYWQSAGRSPALRGPQPPARRLRSEKTRLNP